MRWKQPLFNFHLFIGKSVQKRQQRKREKILTFLPSSVRRGFEVSFTCCRGENGLFKFSFCSADSQSCSPQTTWRERVFPQCQPPSSSPSKLPSLQLEDEFLFVCFFLSLLSLLGFLGSRATYCWSRRGSFGKKIPPPRIRGCPACPSTPSAHHQPVRAARQHRDALFRFFSPELGNCEYLPVFLKTEANRI